VFNSFPIEENLGTPAAGLLLLNYLRYLQ